MKALGDTHGAITYHRALQRAPGFELFPPLPHLDQVRKDKIAQWPREVAIRLSHFPQLLTEGAKTKSQILSSMMQALLQGSWAATRSSWTLRRATSGLSLSHKKQ